MNIFHSAPKNFCPAFAVRVAYNPRLGYQVARRDATQRCAPWLSCAPSLATTRLFSTFQPADPPGTHGSPVFPDIDFSMADKSDDAIRRNSDPKAVFVVTGANRGIGMQLVRCLVDRTMVGLIPFDSHFLALYSFSLVLRRERLWLVAGPLSLPMI